MGYEEWWKSLEATIAEFRKKQATIPPDVMASLRFARTMISVYKADASYLESIPDIENRLLNIESSLINMAKEEFGSAFAENLLKKLEKARNVKAQKIEDSPSRFIPGLPKGEHWIRILPSDDILQESVEKLANDLRLSFKKQNDGYVLVHGDKELVRDFVKKMAEKCRRTKKC